MDWFNKFEKEGCCGDVESHGYIYLGELNTDALLSSPEHSRGEIELEALPSENDGQAMDESLSRASNLFGKTETEIKAESKNAGILRPPRTLSGIAGAGLMVLLGFVLGALTGYFSWAEIQLVTYDVCVNGTRIEMHHAMMGVDIAHFKASALNLFCDEVRESTYVQGGWGLALAALFGVASLRLSYGRAYFAKWNEAESLAEMERLYTQRTNGGLCVLRWWRTRVFLVFTFQIVILLWARYYADLFMDLKAMYIFWQGKDYRYLAGNLCGVFAGLIWTLFEIYKALQADQQNDPEHQVVSKTQVLFVGVTLPLFGMHVTYLSGLSLMQGAQHSFLFISTLAEAIIESAVSSFIQTYAVVYSPMSMSDKASLYESILLSFISIGYAFSTLDEHKGGDLLAKLPGFCKTQTPRWWTVFAFRTFEVTSRMTSIALFQRTFRPYGFFYLFGADFIVLVVMVAFFQYRVGAVASSQWGFVVSNLFYAAPCMICLMAPMLETDCVLTVPPWAYYLLRLVELMVMVYLGGEKYNWELKNFQHDFPDDGLIVLSFVFSTVMTFVLVIIIRVFLTLRVLLEASKDTWTSRAFNEVQQALRNGILLADDGDLTEIMSINNMVENHPDKSNYEYRASFQAQDNHKIAGQSSAEWEAKFLRAKVSSFVEEALTSLDMAEEAEGSVRTVVRIGKGKAKSVKRKTTLGLMGERNSAIDRFGALSTGALVTIRGPDRIGALSCSNGTAQMSWADEKSDQKFVIEAVDNENKRFPVRSGDMIKLRCLESGKFLGLTPSSYRPSDQMPMGPFAAGLPERWWRLWFMRSEEQLATKWTITMVYENIYSSARRVQRAMKMMDDSSLEVDELQHHRRGADVPDLWDPCDWKITMINSKPATRQMLNEILKEGGSHPDDVSEAPSEEKEGGSPALTKGQYRITFEKIDPPNEDDGSPAYERAQMVLGATSTGQSTGFKFLLRSASGWVDAPLGIAGVPLGGIDDTFVGDGKDAVVSHDAKMLKAEAGKQGAIFSFEQTEFMSKDDPSLYQWASQQIRRGHDKMALSASLAEKYRMAVVVAFNARTQQVSGPRQVAGILHSNRDLHRRLLYQLCRIIKSDMDLKVEYETIEEAEDEMSFVATANDSDPLVIEAFTEEDCWAKEQGIDVGDTLALIQITTIQEVEGNPDLDSVRNVVSIACPKEMRAFFRDGTSGEEGESFVTLWFNCSTVQVVQPEVQKAAVLQAQFIASLLPSWAECIMGDLGPDGLVGDAATIKANFMNPHSFFHLKCTLVENLLRTGWPLLHEPFSESAKALHRFMDVAPQGFLWLADMFPDEQHTFIRNEILIRQLKVLSTAWNAVPRSTKEDKPKVLRSLFRADRELQAMYEGVKVLWEQWETATGGLRLDTTAIVEMPEALQYFFKHVKPEDEESLAGNENSVFWLIQAYHQTDEGDLVNELCGKLRNWYIKAETYWRNQVEGGGQQLDDATRFLNTEASSEDVHVVLVANETEMKTVQNALDDSLQLVKDIKIGDSKQVNKGQRLLNLGRVKEILQGRDIRNRLMELRKGKDSGKEIRLLFSSDNFGGRMLEATKALTNLKRLITAVGSASQAFPEKVGEEFDLLKEKHRKGELEVRDIEARRIRQAAERELDEAMDVADNRLAAVELARKRLEEQNEMLNMQKVQLETDKSKLEKEKTELIGVRDKLYGIRDKLMAEKKNLEQQKQTLDNDFAQLQEERNTLKKKKLEQEKALKEVDKYLVNKGEADTKTYTDMIKAALTF